MAPYFFLRARGGEDREDREVREVKETRTIRTIKMVADKFPNGLIGPIGLRTIKDD